MRFKKSAAGEVKQRHLGSARSKAPSNFAYHSSRNISDNEKRNTSIESRTLTTSKPRLFLVMILVLLMLGALGAGLYVSSQPKIIIVQSNSPVNLSYNLGSYQQVAAQAINSSWLNHFKLTLSSLAIANSLERTFPQVQTAVVAVPLVGSTAMITIQLVAPQLIYDNGKSFLIDATGQAVGTTTAPVTGLPVIKSSNSTVITDGSRIMSANNVLFVLTVFKTMAVKGITIKQALLLPAAEELDVYPENTSYLVKFNLHETDARQQVGTYLATLATLRQENKTPAQYIDVRVDGRAFYK